MKKENRQLHSIRVDEDGALARSYEFTELPIQNSITLQNLYVRNLDPSSSYHYFIT
jgi:hypothetical protein